MWAVMSAPAGAAYAVAAANRARFDEPTDRLGTGAGLAIVLLALGAVATAPSANAALQIVLFSTMLAYLAAFDLRSMSIPVWPVLFFCVVGLGLSLADGVAIEHALAGSLGYTAFAALNALYRAVRGQNGLGEGDALIAAMIGTWLGAEALAWSVAIGGLLGMGAALVLRRTQSPLPFVPALAAGAAFTLIWKGLIG
jgi:leader peptidase (prepilin peptidase) / N-methyltransferase